jgi:Tol biopolymer transport system component
MKKWIAYFVLVLGLGLLCSCQKSDNSVPELTYSYVPGYNSGHMFDIYEVNQDGSKHKLLLEATNVGFNQPDWSADGTVMAIWGWHNPMTISIYTYDTKTEVLTRLTNQSNVYDMFPHWNASSDKIVFTRQYLLENDRNEIWSMNADGSDSKKIVDGYAASWSPDGKQLVFSQVTEGNEDLYSCNSDGTNIVKLLDSLSNESFPMWSPDGRLIMFEQFLSSGGVKDINSYEIAVLNLQTGEVKALTNNNYLDIAARWSPDGSKIAFLSQAGGIDDSEIYVMNADGSEVKKVTNTKEGAYATFPSWRPR